MNAGIRYENVVEVCIGCDVSGYVAGGAATTIKKVYGPRSEVFSQNPRVLRTDYLLEYKWRWRHALGDSWWLWPLRINMPSRAYRLADEPLGAIHMVRMPSPGRSAPRNERNERDD